MEKLKKEYDDIVLERTKVIEEINEYKFPKDSNIAIVVGDNKSNNATKLKELLIRREMGDVVMLNEVVDLDEINFEKYNNIYIASGTSTPMDLVERVYNKIKGEIYE